MVTNSLIFAAIILLIICLLIFFSIRKSKKEKIKKYQRKVLIKDLIKTYLFLSKGLKNLEVTNLSLILNKEKSKPKVETYICLFEFDQSKEKLNPQQLAVEVEGINQGSKKKKENYRWTIIQELDLKQAIFLAKLNDKKLIRNKFEKNQLKAFQLEQSLNKLQTLKNEPLNSIKTEKNFKSEKINEEKYIPKRKKIKKNSK